MVFAKRFGESANLSNKIVNNLKEKLLQIAEGYRTGPCFKTANNKTLFHKGERCSGGKKSKIRVTIMLSIKMMGEKKKPRKTWKLSNSWYFKVLLI